MKKIIFGLVLLFALNSVAIQQLTYSLNVNITDNDIGCPKANFSVSSTLPRNWKVTYSVNPIALYPGTIGTVIATITVPRSTIAGTYPVSFTVTNKNNTKYKAVITTSVTVK